MLGLSSTRVGESVHAREVVGGLTCWGIIFSNSGCSRTADRGIMALWAISRSAAARASGVLT